MWRGCEVARGERQRSTTDYIIRLLSARPGPATTVDRTRRRLPASRRQQRPPTPQSRRTQTSNSTYAIHLDTFRSMTQLQTVDLSHNSLREIPPRLFQDNPELSTLQLHENKLQVLPDALLEGPQALSTISLKGNQLLSFPAEVFGTECSLTELDLSNNIALTSAHLEGLALACPQLTRFDANDCSLGPSLPDELFSGTPELIHLGLNSNKLTELPGSLLASVCPQVSTASNRSLTHFVSHAVFSHSPLHLPPFASSPCCWHTALAAEHAPLGVHRRC